MSELQKSVSSKFGCFIVVIMPILLLSLGCLTNRNVELNKDQRAEERRRVEERRNMPPHEVSYEHLTQIPEGEPEVDGEAVIVDGYLIYEDSILESGGKGHVGFRLSKDQSREVIGDKPQVVINYCSGGAPVRNCHTYDKGNMFFSNVFVYSDSGERMSGDGGYMGGIVDESRAVQEGQTDYVRRLGIVRLHGRLSIKRVESNKVDSKLEVWKIEIVK